MQWDKKWVSKHLEVGYDGSWGERLAPMRWEKMWAEQH